MKMNSRVETPSLARRAPARLLALLLAVSVASHAAIQCRATIRGEEPALSQSASTSNKQTDTIEPQHYDLNKTQIDFAALASEFQQDTLKTDTLIKVINDTHGIDEPTRRRLYNLISEHELDASREENASGSKATACGRGLAKNGTSSRLNQAGVRAGRKHCRQIVYEDTIFTNRALLEMQDKMNLSYEGESRSDPSIHWAILYNDTTILVVRGANKYYYWTYVQSVVTAVILFMIVVGNLSILHRLKSCRRRRSNVNYFIVQLAIADLLVGIFGVTLDSWLRIQKAFIWGLFACKASKYVSALFIYSSTYLLVALSIDRWEAVVKPLAFTRNRSRGYHLAAGSWLLAFISALPVTFFSKIKDIDGLPQCWIDLNSAGWRLFMIYLTSLLLILPTLIIAVCYIHIVYTIWSKGRLVAGQQQQRAERSSQGVYSASPESLRRDFSSSSRQNSRPSNLDKESSHRGLSTKLFFWIRRKQPVPSDIGGDNLASGKLPFERGPANNRRSSAEAAQNSRHPRQFKRSLTIETGPRSKRRPSEEQVAGHMATNLTSHELNVQTIMESHKTSRSSSKSLSLNLDDTEAEQPVCDHSLRREGLPTVYSQDNNRAIDPRPQYGSEMATREMLVFDASQASGDKVDLGYDVESGSTTTNTTDSLDTLPDRLNRTDLFGRPSVTASPRNNHSTAKTTHHQAAASGELSSPLKTLTSILTLTANRKPSKNTADLHNNAATGMQPNSQTISKNCDRISRRAAQRGGGPDKQLGQAHHHQQQRRQNPISILSVHSAEPASSGGRDQDFVAQQHGSGVIPKARIKTIKMTLVIVVAYILCWSPFLILNLCGVFGLVKNDTNISHALMTLSQSLAHLNSAVNPIIFWLFSSRRSHTNANQAHTAGLVQANQQHNLHRRH